MVACGSESSPKGSAGSAGSAAPIAPADAALAIDAPSVPRSARVEKVRAEMPDLGSIQRVVVQPDGKLLVIGEQAIARVDADLALDQAFGTGGVVHLALDPAQLQTAAVDDKGRVIVVGQVATKNHGDDMLVVRLSPRGVLDPSFGNAGIVTRDFKDTDDRPSSVFALPKGAIAIIGSHQQGKGAQTYDGYLARLDKHGALAASVAFFDCIAASREFVTRAVADGDGFILGGYAFNEKPEDSGVFVARVRKDGTLDTAFGDHGVARVHSAELGRAVAWELSTASNGDILLGGSAGEEIAKYRGFVVRFDAHGALVSSWGQQGIAWGPPGVRWISMAASDGTGVLAVNRFDGSLVRFDEHGQVDRGFGSEGVVRGDKDDTFDNAVMLDGGDLVIAGDKQLVRYTR
jgi:uncharacterized delta-60 repeat protein